MSNKPKDFFSMTKHERIGTIAVMLLLLAIIVAAAMWRRPAPEPEYASQEQVAKFASDAQRHEEIADSLREQRQASKRQRQYQRQHQRHHERHQASGKKKAKKKPAKKTQPSSPAPQAVPTF